MPRPNGQVLNQTALDPGVAMHAVEGTAERWADFRVRGIWVKPALPLNKQQIFTGAAERLCGCQLDS